MTNQLESLRKLTAVVADTGDIEAIRKYQPVDATTNPSLLLKAAKMSQYQPLISDALDWGKTLSSEQDQIIQKASDKFAVSIGAEIVAMIPGRVSTEVDARLSFDTDKSFNKGIELITLYEQADIDRSRILIKLAATWEGIRAAQKLEQQGINTNLTLLFSFAQAQACAEAGVHLISPFVGRILDMGASFRNVDEIIELAGCDKLTIGPSLLEQLANTPGEITPKLQSNLAQESPKQPLSEAEFRWLMNEDTMASDKLAEGIRNFARDQHELETMLRSLI